MLEHSLLFRINNKLFSWLFEFNVCNCLALHWIRQIIFYCWQSSSLAYLSDSENQKFSTYRDLILYRRCICKSNINDSWNYLEMRTLIECFSATPSTPTTICAADTLTRMRFRSFLRFWDWNVSFLGLECARFTVLHIHTLRCTIRWNRHTSKIIQPFRHSWIYDRLFSFFASILLFTLELYIQLYQNCNEQRIGLLRPECAKSSDCANGVRPAQFIAWNVCVREWESVLRRQNQDLQSTIGSMCIWIIFSFSHIHCVCVCVGWQKRKVARKWSFWRRQSGW